MKTIKQVFIFDIDGVLTNIETHKIEEKQLLDFILRILKKNEPMAFNTGRSLYWVKNEIITTIEAEIDNKKLLSNLFVVAEKGGARIEFDDDGNEVVFIDKLINIPNSIKNALRKMVRDSFPNEVFYDETKQTMATIQKNDNLSLEEFEKIHSKLNEEIGRILQIHDKVNMYKLVPTTLDTDIESRSVGKDFAVSKVLEWLRKKGISAEKFITFGDSPTDIEMFKYLIKNGHKAKFIYVGSKEIESGERIIKTTKHYDEGTLEYLSSN